MGIIRRVSNFSAVIFDLDETLLAREPAWVYTIEEAVAAVTGRRIDARPLAEEYRHRPWRHVLRVLLNSPAEIAAAEDLCRDIAGRSAMKRLLVQEGIGMALDRLRGASVDIGGVTHEVHAVARREVESTGLERFITVLSATPAGSEWDVVERLRDCLRFVEREPARCAFVSHDVEDLARAAALGMAAAGAGWVSGGEVPGFVTLEKPDELVRLLA